MAQTGKGMKWLLSLLAVGVVGSAGVGIYSAVAANQKQPTINNIYPSGDTSKTIAGLQDKINVLTKQQKALQDKISDDENQMSQMNKEISANKNNLDEANKVISSLNDKIAELQKQIDGGKVDSAKLQAQIDDLNGQIGSANDNKDGKTSVYWDKSTGKSTTSQNTDKTLPETWNSKFNGASATISGLNIQLQSKQADLDKANADKKKLQSTIDEDTNTINNLKGLLKAPITMGAIKNIDDKLTTFDVPLTQITTIKSGTDITSDVNLITTSQSITVGSFKATVKDNKTIEVVLDKGLIQNFDYEGQSGYYIALQINSDIAGATDNDAPIAQGISQWLNIGSKKSASFYNQTNAKISGDGLTATITLDNTNANGFESDNSDKSFNLQGIGDTSKLPNIRSVSVSDSIMALTFDQAFPKSTDATNLYDWGFTFNPQGKFGNQGLQAGTSNMFSFNPINNGGGDNTNANIKIKSAEIQYQIGAGNPGHIKIELESPLLKPISTADIVIINKTTGKEYNASSPELHIIQSNSELGFGTPTGLESGSTEIEVFDASQQDFGENLGSFNSKDIIEIQLFNSIVTATKKRGMSPPM